MKPVTTVETQVSAPFGSIPDFVGFDDNGDKRVVGESKFWAGLGEGQAGRLPQAPAQHRARLCCSSSCPRCGSIRLWAAVTVRRQEIR